jgi:hypothetical protein
LFMQSALAPVNRTPMCEIPGKALILVSRFCERGLAQLENVVIAPGAEDGTVDLFAMGRTRAISITCEGTCQRRLEIGGESLSLLRKRHADAEHVVILPAAGETDLPMLSVRSFSQGMTLALQVPEADGGLSVEDVGKAMNTLQSESAPRSTTVLDRQLLSQTLALLAPQGQVRLEQRHRGVVLHVTADDFTGQVLICGITPQS